MADTKDAEDAKDLGVTEKFDDYVLGASGPIYPTAVDATGQERIVGPKIDNWQPAQVEPDPDEVERLEKVMAAQAEARQTRLGLRLGDALRLLEPAAREHDRHLAVFVAFRSGHRRRVAHGLLTF